MSPKELLLVGFLLAAAGSVLGMSAAIRMANGYHPFTTSGFLGHLLSLTWRVATFDRAGWKREVEAAVEVSRHKAENRAALLGGLYLLFLAFLLELLGSTMMYFASR